MRQATSRLAALATTAAAWITTSQPSAAACHGPGSPTSPATISRLMSVAMSIPRTSWPVAAQALDSLPADEAGGAGDEDRIVQGPNLARLCGSIPATRRKI